MNKHLLTHLMAGCALALAPVAAQAQDSATVDVVAELVEAPATFTIIGVAPLDFGQVALPKWQGEFSVCTYTIAGIGADGSASLELPVDDRWANILYPVGTVSSGAGCYAVGDFAPAHFEFSCTSENIEFSFTPSASVVLPEWQASLIPPQNFPGDSRPQLVIAKDGVLVTSSNDVAATGGPLTIDCNAEGAGTYDLYAGGRLDLTATADTSTVTLGVTNLGTLTVDAIY